MISQEQSHKMWHLAIFYCYSNSDKKFLVHNALHTYKLYKAINRLDGQ